MKDEGRKEGRRMTVMKGAVRELINCCYLLMNPF